MSRAAAIHQMCKDCIYDPIQKGAWRQQTEACVSGTCPLHPYRPRSTAKTGENGPDSEISPISDLMPQPTNGTPERGDGGRFLKGGAL